jgi:hypothetical protein
MIPVDGNTSEISASPDAVPSAEAPKHVDGLWFHDGTLIIRAENTEFKVYGELLANHSSGIAGMIAASTPDTKDRCDFVHLPDNAIDVEYFLKAILDRRGLSRLEPLLIAAKIFSDSLIHIQRQRNFPSSPVSYA